MSLGQGLDLQALGMSVFNAVVAHYAAAGPGAEPLPLRQYCAAGDAVNVAWDCEQFTVSLQAIGYGSAPDAGTLSAQSGSNLSVFGVRHAVFAAQLVRCVAQTPENAEFPAVAAMQADGLRFFRDAGLISQSLTELASRLRQSLGRGVQIVTGDVLPVGVEGDLVGMVASFTVTAGELT